MFKHAQDISTDNDRSNKNPHLSDEQLLLVLDGELSPREAACVELHLQACWSCRTRSEQLGDAIADVVEYCRCLTTPYLSPPPGTRANFTAQLEQLIRTAGQPSFWIRIRGAFRLLDASLQGMVPRHVWLSGIIIIGAALFLFTRLWHVPKVSASQFLENAQISEKLALDNVVEPVVYQKLRIRVGTQDVTRTIYRDPGGKRRTDRLHMDDDKTIAVRKGQSQDPSSASQVETELRRTFRRAHLDWENPLSPANFMVWRNSISQKQDEVTQVGEKFMTLKTTALEGPIMEAGLTVRTQDFHPVAEYVRLDGTQQVEVKELTWEVIPVEMVDPAIFGVETRASPAAPRTTFRIPAPAGPTEAELAEAELETRLAMHTERADLGEQIEIRNTPNFAPYGQQSLIIRGILSTTERKDELSAVFRRIPHVELQLETAEEAAARQDRVARDTTQQSETSDFALPPDADESGTEEHRENREAGSGNAVAEGPGPRGVRETSFPNAEVDPVLVNKVVNLAQDALAQAWALRRLRDRYAPEEVALLSHGSKLALELLIHDNVSALRRHTDAAQSLLSSLLPPDPASAEPSNLKRAEPLPAAEVAKDWRSAVNGIFPEIQEMYSDVVALFAQSSEATSDTLSRAYDLRSALTKLEVQVPMLYETVSRPFLSEPNDGDR